MFNHKKIFTALLLAPLFVACTINGDDSDDVGNTETDPTAATATVTATTTVGTDGDTTASTTVSTTVSTDDSGSGDTAVDSGSDDGSTGEPPAGMFCQAACEEAVDCCDPAIPTCADSIGEYPFNYTCDAGVCGSGDGCAETADCDAVYPGLGYECIVVEGYGYCELPCTETADCVGSFECLDDGAGGMSCQFSCSDSTECGVEGAICEDDGTCTYPGCGSDEDCLQGGTCDVATGVCGCADATECVEGYTCTG